MLVAHLQLDRLRIDQQPLHLREIVAVQQLRRGQLRSGGDPLVIRQVAVNVARHEFNQSGTGRQQLPVTGDIPLRLHQLFRRECEKLPAQRRIVDLPDRVEIGMIQQQFIQPGCKNLIARAFDQHIGQFLDLSAPHPGVERSLIYTDQLRSQLLPLRFGRIDEHRLEAAAAPEFQQLFGQHASTSPSSWFL